VVVAAEATRIEGLAPRLHAVAAQPVVARAADPGLVSVPQIALHWNRAAQVATDVRGDVVAGNVRGEKAGRADEPPGRVGDVGVVGEARRRPADVAIALAPLHPGRTPPRPRPPHPAVRPDPAPVVIGRPSEGIGRLPG